MSLEHHSSHFAEFVSTLPLYYVVSILSRTPINAKLIISGIMRLGVLTTCCQDAMPTRRDLANVLYILRDIRTGSSNQQVDTLASHLPECALDL